MRKMFLAIVLSVGLISGCGDSCENCKPEKTYCRVQNVQTNQVKLGAFNDEVYVWEGFIFTTNKIVDGVQK